GETGNHHLGLMLHSQTLHLVIIDQTGFRIKTVLDSVVVFARTAHLGTLGQVATMSQTHAQNRIARRAQSSVYRLVCLRTRVGLDVGIIGAEQLFSALDGQAFALVNIFATAVVTLARIAFRIFIGQLGALSSHHQWAGVVFRSNQFDMLLLTTALIFNRGPDFGIKRSDSLVLIKHCRSPKRPAAETRRFGLLGSRIGADCTPFGQMPAMQKPHGKLEFISRSYPSAPLRL